MKLKSLLLTFLLTTFVASETTLVVLGSGTPNPDPSRSGSAYAVIVDDQTYLVDFGTGVVRSAAALTPKYGGEIEQLDPVNLKIAFLTHIHSDHTLGLADLMLTPWIMGRDTPLKLYGPVGLKAMGENIINTYKLDIDYRINGTQPSNKNGYKINAHEIQEGLIYEDKNIKVTAFLNNHGNLNNSFGYVFNTKDKKIVFSGDTAPSKNLKKFSKNADILVHEIYSSEGFLTKTEDWKIYHKAHHTSSKDIGNIAEDLNIKTLVLSHILYWGADDKSILNDINNSSFKGNTFIAFDSLVVQ